MAKFTTTGVEDFLRQLSEYGEAASESVPVVLRAGAEAAKAEMEETSAWADKSGQLRRSIKISKVKGSGSASFIEVYPSGTTADGTRLEEVGFVLEYGRGVSTFTRVTKNGVTKTYVISPSAPRPWVRPAIENNPKIVDAMERKWKERMQRG